jgi:EF hand
MEADKDGDGKISFEEFCQMVASTVCSAMNSLTIGCGGEYDLGRRVVASRGGSCISVYPCGLAFRVSIIACHVRKEMRVCTFSTLTNPKFTFTP